jgi:hypothetical protein
MKKRLYAFYSKKADELCSHCLYETIDGNIIKVTLVSSDPLAAYVGYNWEDKEYVGEVVKCVRTNPIYNNFSMGVSVQEELKNECFRNSFRRLYPRMGDS